MEKFMLENRFTIITPFHLTPYTPCWLTLYLGTEKLKQFIEFGEDNNKDLSSVIANCTVEFPQFGGLLKTLCIILHWRCWLKLTQWFTCRESSLYCSLSLHISHLSNRPSSWPFSNCVQFQLYEKSTETQTASLLLRDLSFLWNWMFMFVFTR